MGRTWDATKEGVAAAWGGLKRRSVAGAYNFRDKAFAPKTVEQSLDKSGSGASLQKCLGAVDLTLLGVGGIVGAGVFVLTGVAARENAGPAVTVAYLMASLAALLSALCYTEFAVELPVAGAAYNYVGLVFGEFPAWCVAANLILEYTLSAAAVARGFTSYFATFLGLGANAFRFYVPGVRLNIDLPAAAIIIAESMILARGTKQGSMFNTIVTAINLIVIAFVIGAGAPHVDPANYTPFAPFGARRVFTAASQVFFSFIGFDMVANTAEEVKNPSFDLPCGIVGSLGICAFLYAGMSLVITGMESYADIDINAPFAQAFEAVNMGWAGRIVSLGAVTGILTSLLVGLLGQARVYIVVGREKLLPAWVAAVDPVTQTPKRATWITAAAACALAVFIDISTLADLVSVGTLFVFLCVALAVLQRRFVRAGTPFGSCKPVLLRYAALVATSLGATISYTLFAPWPVWASFLVLWGGVTASFYRVPVVWWASKFSVPLSPFVPCLSVLANIFLIGSLNPLAYIRFLVWMAIAVVVYFYYGVHNSDGGGVSDKAEGPTADEAGPSGMSKISNPMWSGMKESQSVEMMPPGIKARSTSSASLQAKAQEGQLLEAGATPSDAPVAPTRQ